MIDKDLRIIGDNVYLRPITVEDTDLVLSWRNSENVVKNFIHRKLISREEHLNWLETKVDTGKVIQFIICDKNDDTPLGSIYLQNYEPEHKRAEEGIFLGDKAIAGKGIGSEAGRLMIKYGFETLGLHKMTARVLAYNTASLRMHEKAGYKQEAYFKDELFLDGKYEDLVFFGVVNTND